MRKGIIAVFVLAFCTLLPAQKTLNNDEVIKLVKAGLSDDLIVSTINATPGTYNTSADGLIALKSAGASDKVIEAIESKAAKSSTGTAPVASAPVSDIAHPSDLRQRTPSSGSGTSSASTGQPRIFVKADQNFNTALVAAIEKKHVPATVVTEEANADYILQSASVANKQESGASKFARCMFAYCAGIEGSSSVSVQLIKVSDGSVAWAYQVRKGNGGPAGVQSLSEAVAKHLKNDFLDRKK